jgi:hypothetical protein
LNEKGRKYNSKVHMKSGERSMTFNKRKWFIFIFEWQGILNNRSL